MKLKVKKVVETKKDIVTAIICDVCKSEIPIDSKNLYYEVTTHNRWAGLDSIEHYDLCGGECLNKHHLEYFAEEADMPGYTYEIKTEEA